jgi:hypothetical protein
MAPSQRRHPPSHQKSHGILSAREGSTSTTALDSRFWKRMRKTLPRNPRHSRNRHLFHHRTEKHPRRQKDHLRQNSLRLKTSQGGKGTCSANRRRRQTRLIRQRHHFNSLYHNIQDPNQPHPIHRGIRYDDDGHQKLLPRHPTATV